MTVQEAATQLNAALTALATDQGLRHYPDPGAVIDPPGTVLGPPALTWEGYCDGPTSARFLVYVVVPVDERALERLWALVPQVANAVQEQVSDATVTRADPGTFTGTVDLPCYEIQIDVSL